jgi:hypothetical protein
MNKGNGETQYSALSTDIVHSLKISRGEWLGFDSFFFKWLSSSLLMLGNVISSRGINEIVVFFWLLGD